jgi:hypothetical protein
MTTVLVCWAIFPSSTNLPWPTIPKRNHMLRYFLVLVVSAYRHFPNYRYDLHSAENPVHWISPRHVRRAGRSCKQESQQTQTFCLTNGFPFYLGIFFSRYTTLTSAYSRHLLLQTTSHKSRLNTLRWQQSPLNCAHFATHGFSGNIDSEAGSSRFHRNVSVNLNYEAVPKPRILQSDAETDDSTIIVILNCVVTAVRQQIAIKHNRKQVRRMGAITVQCAEDCLDQS